MEPTYRTTRIVTHTAPHLDEIFAIWLLRRYGEGQFPGVSNAPVEYWTETMAATSWQDHHAAGSLLIGVGGGRFDEHPVGGRERKEDQSATSLVATALGLRNDEALKRMIDYIVEDDLKGSLGWHSLASLVVTLHRRHPASPQLVIDWATTAIEAIIELQQQFFDQTRVEYEAKVVFTPFKRGGRKLKIASIVSDDPQVKSFAMSKAGKYAAVVIIRNSQGQTSIFANKYYQIKLRDIARVVRVEEQKAAGGNIKVTSFRVLGTEGMVPEIAEWFYFEEGEMLLNGSPTHPDVPPTRLSLERLVELTVLALSDRAFEPERQDQCRAGVCSATPITPCPWYRYGLGRCAHIRFTSREAQAGK